MALSPFCWVGTDFAIRRSYLRESEIPIDQLRLQVWYQQRGFREVEVDTASTIEEDGRVAISFIIREGEPVLVTSIEFEGVDQFEGDGLLEGLPLQVGDPLNLLALDATRETLSRRLANRGYARVDVLLRHFIPADSYRARVTFDVDPGPSVTYGPLTVVGNDELSESTVLNTLQFQPGDAYDIDELQQAHILFFARRR